ncbi:MAG TPA: PRC-barrel domain-containing protein [Planctomycetota bacterium]|nr:PRC-barrel domain-containing protein [Planctomycetota bacterium]
MNNATVKILILCVTALAGTIPARAALLQDPTALPVVNERVLHVYRADALEGLTVKGDGDQEIGKLESFLIDATDGEIAYAVIAEGGMLGLGVQHRLVPWNVLHFSPKGGSKRDKDKANCEVVALLSEDDVAQCPTFKRGEAVTADLERKAHRAAHLPPIANLAQRQASRLLSSVDIPGCRVQGKSQAPLGSIEHLLVDPMEGRVAYVVLETKSVPGLGEKRIAVPWAATEVAIDAAKKIVLTTQLSKERLETAPIYVGKDWKRMTSPAWLREVALYFNVEPYWVRGAPPSATSAVR